MSASKWELCALRLAGRPPGPLSGAVDQAAVLNNVLANLGQPARSPLDA